jgi:hypothetical protein
MKGPKRRDRSWPDTHAQVYNLKINVKEAGKSTMKGNCWNGSWIGDQNYM